MVLYNPALADTPTDNHWLPTVHLANGTDFVAFMTSHTGVTGSFPAGEKRNGQGDVMAAFSSRGPAGLFLKPDVTAPGVQVLAGASPFPATPDPVNGGSSPGELFQAIAGTSMSSPHVAGAGLLLKAAHPRWNPGQIKSALMTTATTDVLKEDLVTAATPLDMGSGRIDIGAASEVPLTFSDTAQNFFAMANDPANAVHLNIPSIYAPAMAGRLVTTRVATNTDRAASALRGRRRRARRLDDLGLTDHVLGLNPDQSVDVDDHHRVRGSDRCAAVRVDRADGTRRRLDSTCRSRSSTPRPACGSRRAARQLRSASGAASRRARSRRRTTRSTTRRSTSTRSQPHLRDRRSERR